MSNEVNMSNTVLLDEGESGFQNILVSLTIAFVGSNRVSLVSVEMNRKLLSRTWGCFTSQVDVDGFFQEAGIEMSILHPLLVHQLILVDGEERASKSGLRDHLVNTRR